MRMMEKLKNLMRPDRQSVEEMVVRSENVSHDLTNLKARVDFLSRLVGRMQEDKVWRNGSAPK